jgi:DNA-directed RNA polymerase subunit alpha
MIVLDNRGYITAEANFDEKLGLDFIPLDSSHSPIKKVNYRVEPARVGKRIDYEGLTLEVWTTGAIAPIEAISQAAKILRDHMIIFMNIVDEPLEKEQVVAKREVPYMGQMDILSKPIEHLELSVRSNNCLRSAGIEKIYELVQKSEEELLKTKNFGRKSLSEIKETLSNLGLGLSLDLNSKLLERIKGEAKPEIPAKELDA